MHAQVPADAQLVMEIGANTRNTLDRELLPLAPSAFLLSFEPLLDKYAALIVGAQQFERASLREPSPAPLEA